MAKKKRESIVKTLIKGAKAIEKRVKKTIKVAEKAEKKRRQIGKSVREFQEKGKASQTEHMKRGGFVIPDYPPKRKTVKRKKNRR